VSSPNQRGLLCTIQKESLLPVSALSPASSSFSDDLSLLAPHLQPKEALYIILRRYASSEPAPFVAITYVPDAAPVRQKMLFASTRLTLTRELGIERFRETIFCTTPAELTAEGFEKHDKHTKLEAPLTEEEQTLGEVKRKEAEEGRGMAERKSHVSSGVSMPVEGSAVDALKALESETGHNFVSLVCTFSSFLYHTSNSIAENQHPNGNVRPRHHLFNPYLLPRKLHLPKRASLHFLSLHTYPPRRGIIPNIVHLHLPNCLQNQRAHDVCLLIPLSRHYCGERSWVVNCQTNRGQRPR
jgi:hypothetical protein